MIIRAIKKMTHLLPDEMYLRLRYYRHMRKRLNLAHPDTFNEKIQWLKLYDRRPEYVRMVDKYEAKKLVSEMIGDEYVIPVYGVYEHADDINFEELPDQFVLKCTHDCGSAVICKDKNRIDIKKIKKNLSRCLKRNYFWNEREWPYKYVRPRILAEKYMEDTETEELRDYKIFTFGGKAKVLFVATERQKDGKEVKFDFFDRDFRHLDIKNGHANAKLPLSRPETLDKMLELAEKLSEGYPQLRVDFYEVDGHIYFGELTLYHWGGFVPFEPEEWDHIMGQWITLPEPVCGTEGLR